MKRANGATQYRNWGAGGIRALSLTLRRSAVSLVCLSAAVAKGRCGGFEELRVTHDPPWYQTFQTFDA